jgi:AcrR family transcriptional regulator
VEQAILETGKKLFFRFGVRRVTVEEISAEAGVSKVTFYKYFKNKDDLFLRVMKELIQEGLDLTREVMNRDISFAEMVEELLRYKYMYMETYSQEFINEYLQDFPGIMKSLAPLLEKREKLLVDLYHMGRQRKEIRKEVNLELFQYLMGHALVMVTDPQLEAMYPDGRERVRIVTNFIFFGLMRREAQGGKQ